MIILPNFYLSTFRNVEISFLAPKLLSAASPKADAQCWFHEPRALYSNRKLFIGTNGSDNNTNTTGRASLYEVDDVTGDVSQYTFATGPQWCDDHNYPSTLVRPDGRIIAFYSAHNLFGEPVRYRISVAVGSGASGWSQEYTLGAELMTYPSPVMLTGEDNKIYLFFRGGVDASYSYYTSTDLATVAPAMVDGGALGATPAWSSVSKLTGLGSGEAAYAKLHSNGIDRIDVCICNSNSPNVGNKEDVRHCYYQSGSWHAADGTDLGALPIAFESIPAIATSAAPDNFGNIWPWHIVYRAANDIEVVFARFISTRDHRAYYAKWNGTAWSKTEIDAGLGGGVPDTRSSQISDGQGFTEGFYAPGLYIDYNAPGVVYCSVGNMASSILYRYTTTDDGSTWSRVRISDADKENVRPFVPIGAEGKVAVLWMRGYYHNFDFAATSAPDNGYTTQIVAAPRNYSLAEYVDPTPVNLCPNSEAFNLWAIGGTSNAPNQAANPVNGAVTADRIREAATTAAHNINFPNLSFTAGLQYTFSVYAKYETVQWIQLLFQSAAFNTVYANFDIQNGVLGSAGNGTFSKIEALADGWYRISITAVASATAATGGGVYGAQASNSVRAVSYLGDTTKTWLLFGAQVRQGALPGLYVPT